MLETPKLMSIDEIRDVFQQEPTTYQKGLVRPYPEAVTDTVQRMIVDGKSLSEIIAYGRGSFDIFRASVNSDLDVPHSIDQNGVYQWPVPERFDWTDVSAVIELGSKIDKENSTVGVSDGRNVKQLDVDTGRMAVRDMTKDETEIWNMGSDFKYIVPALSGIGFVADQREWQSYLLKIVHNPLGWMRAFLRNGSISEDLAKDQIMEMMDTAKRPIPDNLVIINR